MPSEKRARQRAARDARLEAERQAQKRRKQYRNGAIVVVIAGVVVLIAFLLSNNHNNKPVQSQSKVTTTHDGVGEVECRPPDQGQRGRREGRLPEIPDHADRRGETDVHRRTAHDHRHVEDVHGDVQDDDGDVRSDVGRNERTADGQQLRLPCQQGLLQLRQLLPGHPRLRAPDRQSRADQLGQRTWIHDPRRTSPQGIEPRAAVPSGIACHGQYVVRPNTGGSQFFIVSGTQGEACPTRTRSSDR